MPKIDVLEDQILQSLDQLSPQGRRQALKRLLPSAAYLERAIERNRPRIEALARQCGLEWNALTEEQKEQLVDAILHEQGRP
jgi:hypothetical protein